MFLESMAYIYFAAVIELKFPTNLLMSDIVAFFNNESPSVDGVNLASNDWYHLFSFWIIAIIFFQILFEFLVKGEIAQGMIKEKDLV